MDIRDRNEARAVRGRRSIADRRGPLGAGTRHTRARSDAPVVPRTFLTTSIGKKVVFKVQVGPAQIAIHQGQSVLVTKPDGEVKWPSKRGLYFRDTRVISAWRSSPTASHGNYVNGGAVAPHAARICLTRISHAI